MQILVTGAAGFIGYHLSKRLIKDGHQVIGIDNINDYYNTALKIARLADLGITPPIADSESLWVSNTKNLLFYKIDLADRLAIENLFEEFNFDMVCNLAAQAGVRYSLNNPHSYIKSNIDGFLNILEGCRHNGVKKLVYASSSSVYGNNKDVPFKTTDNVDRPISLYAATKRSNELMAYSYSHLYDIEIIGLRFFTVYGPWGRPDMAYFSFTEAILNNKPIRIFNHGELYRDFTYIEDIIDGIDLVLNHQKSPGQELHRIYNIGNGKPIKLLDFISQLENILGSEAKKELIEMQPGDVHITYADTNQLQKDMGYLPKFVFRDGLKAFAKWYVEVYNLEINN